jgi:hypothetical protein
VSCGPSVERETPDAAEIGKLGAVRNSPDQDVWWNWGDLNPRPPRCERCSQNRLTRGNGS